MKRLTIISAVVALAVAASAGTASADPPNNGKASLWSVNCPDLGSGLAVAVFFASDAPTAGTTSAFHVIGASNVTLIVFTGGLVQLPTYYCEFTWVAGDPPRAGWEFFATDAFVMNAP